MLNLIVNPYAGGGLAKNNTRIITKYLKKAKIDTLETAYDSYLLETQHKLSLLGFEYQLESEEI